MTLRRARTAPGVFAGAWLLCCALPLAAQDAQNSSGPGAPRDAPTPEIAAELTPPVLKKDVQPIYPEAAQASGIGAVVVLDIDIDAVGIVESAIVTLPAEPADLGFDEAALVAAKQLEFEPARIGDEPVPVRISYRFSFVPDVKQLAAPPAPAASEPVVELPTGELWGALQERGTRLPLAGVKVTAFRGEGEAAEGYETETDAQGKFHFEGLGIDDWRVLADPEGYYPLRATESIATDERTEVRYLIEKRSYNPYDVVVETDRVHREVNRTSIDARQAERIPGTFGDVLRVVQNFPGVARAGFGETVVRGSDPEDTRYYIEGIDVPAIYHFGGLRGVLPVGMIERLDFYPGNFSVEFGRATGGIIDIGLRQLAPEKLGGYADVSILDTSLYAEMPIGEDFAFALGARRSYIDVLLGEVLPQDGASITLPRYWDFQALASWRPTPAHQVEAFYFLSYDTFEVLFEKPVAINPNFVFSDVNLAQDFNRTILLYTYVPGEAFENELKLSYGRDNFDLNVGTPLFVHVTSDQGQLREMARYKVSDGFAVRAGIDYIFQTIDYSLRLPQFNDEGDDEAPPELDPDTFVLTEINDTMHSSAGFLELELNPIESLLLVPGIRVDHFTRTKEIAVSPRFTARQAISERWALKAGVGLFVQEPQFLETDARLGNPELGLEKAIHYSAGVEFRPQKHINLELTGFYKTLYDLVGPTDDLTDEGDRMRYNNGADGRVIGLEVSLRHELADRFFGWVAYTLSRAERRDPAETAWTRFEYDQTHILTVIGSYKLPRNWEISSRFRYVTGNLYTPITGAVVDSDVDQYQGIPGATYSARVGDFHQLDIRLDKRWIYKSWILNAYLDIQNVYSQENADGLSYNYDYSEAEESEGLPIVPIIGLRGEF